MNKKERTRMEHIQRMMLRKRLRETEQKLRSEDLTEDEKFMYTLILKQIKENLKKDLETGK